MTHRICPECGCEDIRKIDSETGECTACGLVEHISIFEKR